MSARRERKRGVHENLNKALSALERSVAAPVLEPRDRSGIIKDFEIVYELSWKALKEHLAHQGHETGTARQVFQTAYQLGVIANEETWLRCIEDRNNTVHTYNEGMAAEMCERIGSLYLPEFRQLAQALAA